MRTSSILKQKQLIVGLTGGIGSGKTVVSNWFAKQGIDIIDADVIAHEVVNVGSETLKLLTQEFGNWIITENGVLNRKALREYVFKNSQALTKLENITHPAIHREIQLGLSASTSKYTILSVPLLLESRKLENIPITNDGNYTSSKASLASLCDHIVVVDVPREIQILRASSRDGQSVEQINAILDKQLSRETRNSFADDIVDNNCSLDELYKKLALLHAKFTNM